MASFNIPVAVYPLTYCIERKCFYRFQIDGREWWENIVQPSMADNSDSGKLITQAEYDEIHRFPLPVNVTRAMADKLLMRFNNTYYNWDHGTLQGDNMVDYTEFNTLAKHIETDLDEAKQVRAKQKLRR